MMTKKLNTVFAMVLLFAHLPAMAGDKAEPVIQLLSKAYNADKLKSLNSIKIYDYNKSLWPGQDESPGLPDFWKLKETLLIDFVKQRKSLLSWREVRTVTDFEQYISSKEGGRVYDLVYQKYFDDSWYNYSNTGRSIERSSDTLIAKQLLENTDQLSFDGLAQFRGVEHYQVSLPLFGNSPHQILIDSRTGVIAKVTAKHARAGELVYVFSNHKSKAGISYARDLSYFVGGKARKVSIYRNLDLNPDTQRAFQEPAGFSAWGKPSAPSTKGPRLLGHGVYLVGSGRSQSIFVEADDYFIASGGGRKLDKNYQSLLDETGSNKPLKYVVLPHHHTEHLQLIKPALALNASIVTSSNALALINKTLGRDISKEELLLVDKEAALGDVRILKLATAHAAENLVLYLPKQKMLYSHDHFGTIYENGTARPFKDMKTFIEKVNELELDIETYIDGRSPRLLSSKEVKSIIGRYKSPTCAKQYDVCQEGHIDSL